MAYRMPQSVRVSKDITTGVIVFTTTAFNLFLIPSMLAEAGAPLTEASTSVALIIAIACISIGLIAKRPLIVAPGIATTAYLVYTVVLGTSLSLPAALASAFCAGVLFFLLASFGLHKFLYNAIPECIRVAFLGGLGLFLIIIGLRQGGLIVYEPWQLPSLGRLLSPEALLSSMGLVFMIVLALLKVRLVLLFGLLHNLLVAWLFGLLTLPEQLISLPVWPKTLVFNLDFSGFFTLPFLSAVLGLFLVTVLGVAGTLTGLEALFDSKKKLLGSRATYMTTAASTVLGSLFGLSPNVVLGQSAIALQEGSRNGVSSVVMGVLFGLALFIGPLFAAVPMAAVAPLLIVVGAVIFQAVTKVSWQASENAVPGLVTVVVTILSMDIASGLALGMLSYLLCYIFSGRTAKIHMSSYPLTVILVVYLLSYS